MPADPKPKEPNSKAPAANEDKQAEAAPAEEVAKVFYPPAER